MLEYGSQVPSRFEADPLRTLTMSLNIFDRVYAAARLCAVRSETVASSPGRLDVNVVISLDHHRPSRRTNISMSCVQHQGYETDAPHRETPPRYGPNVSAVSGTLHVCRQYACSSKCREPSWQCNRSDLKT